MKNYKIQCLTYEQYEEAKDNLGKKDRAELYALDYEYKLKIDEALKSDSLEKASLYLDLINIIYDLLF
jgi:hypothetical protein